MSDSVFKNPEAVKQQLDLPAIINYSFVGDSSPEYHARVVATIEKIVGPENIRRRDLRPSSKGNYTAYKFEVYQEKFEEMEELYRLIGALEGTKFLL